MAKPTCFVIAPITTPAHRLQHYKDGDAHCAHVLEHLLLPAVEQAGFDPISPRAKGSELIQAGIVSKLQKSDLVLCDMSCLNPNVFFELGMRTAQNGSICLAIDDVTRPEVPFDLAAIHHHEYKSDFIWERESTIKGLVEHVLESAKAKNNALWDFFALRMAAPATEGIAPSDKFELVASELAALRAEVARNSPSKIKHALDPNVSLSEEGWLRWLEQSADVKGIKASFFKDKFGSGLVAAIDKNDDAEAMRELTALAADLGYSVRFVKL